jgi:DNA-binding transcriptional LysR family regulator
VVALQTAEACLETHEVSFVIAMELGSNEAVKRAATAGLGLGVVSKLSAAPDVMAGLLVTLDVEGWDCRRPLTIVYRNDEHLSAAQRAFLQLLRDEHPLRDGV